MKEHSFNITAIGLFVISLSIITVSNVWILYTEEISLKLLSALSYSNLASVFSTGVAVVISQVNLYNKNNQIKNLKNNVDVCIQV